MQSVLTMAPTVAHPGRQRRGHGLWSQLRVWLLLLPLTFLAVHGQPSFMQADRNTENGVSIAASAQPSERYVALTRALVYTSYGTMLLLGVFAFHQLRRNLFVSPALMLLAGLALTSILWSQVPSHTLRYGFYYGLDTLFAIYLVSVFSLEELQSLMMGVGTVIVCLSFASVLFFPQFGIVHIADHRGVWQGIFSEKNDAAKNLVFLLSPVCGRRITRPLSLLYAASIVLLVVMTGSVTSMIIATAYIVFLFALQWFRRFKASDGMILTVLGIAALVAVVVTGYMEFDALAALFGRDTTLTGRTEIWGVLVQSVRQRPWLGYGFSAFWTGMAGESGRLYEQVHWYFSYAHSGLLEILLQLGCAGLALVLVAYAQAVRHAVYLVRRSTNNGVLWLTGLLFLTLLFNFDEGTILFNHSLVSLFFLIACSGLAKEWRAWRALTVAVRRVRPAMQERSVLVA